MAKKIKARSGESNRTERVAELKAQLADFEASLSDEEKTAIYAQVQGYSERNQMLIVMQMPGATEVRGYRAWQDLGRQVRKGEKAIWILAPAGSKTEEKIVDGKKDEKERMFFRPVSIFDITQTDGQDSPTVALSQAIQTAEAFETADGLVDLEAI